MSEPSARNDGKCAICGKPKHANYRPFCSKRCADVDLHRWFTEHYAIAAEEGGEPGGDRDGEN